MGYQLVCSTQTFSMNFGVIYKSQLGISKELISKLKFNKYEIDLYANMTTIMPIPVSMLLRRNSNQNMKSKSLFLYPWTQAGHVSYQRNSRYVSFICAWKDCTYFCFLRKQFCFSEFYNKPRVACWIIRHLAQSLLYPRQWPVIFPKQRCLAVLLLTTDA